MQNAQGKFLNFSLKYIAKPLQAKMPINPFVMRTINKLIELACKLFFKTPDFVFIKKTSAGGVPAEWLIAGDNIDKKKVILYIHGGGYFFGSSITHRPITWRLAQRMGVKVLSIDYRLMPDNIFSDCREDAVAAYKWLLSEGYKPENIVIGGDSAGGGLALITLLKLKNQKIPQPRAAFVISPFADMSGAGKTLETNAKKSYMFHRDAMKRMRRFISKNNDPNDPLVSPAFGDYKGLPSLFIQVGDSELLLHDSFAVAIKAEEAGIDVTFKVWNNVPHVFIIFSDFIPEGKQGIEEIAKFIADKFETKLPA